MRPLLHNIGHRLGYSEKDSETELWEIASRIIVIGSVLHPSNKHDDKRTLYLKDFMGEKVKAILEEAVKNATPRLPN